MNQIEQLVQNLSNAVGLESDSAFIDLLETGISLAPYLGKMLQMVKINRLERRFKEHDEQLKRIAKLNANSALSSDYAKERIFPIVFEDLIEEHEDAKINLILNGFENVFIEENSNESLVINYYDTLRELRYSDIKRLLYLTGHIESYPLHPVDSDDSAMVRNIDAKLERLNLIARPIKVGQFTGGEFDTVKSEVKQTMYVSRFLNFILEKEQL
jgi:hypothetical protein